MRRYYCNNTSISLKGLIALIVLSLSVVDFERIHLKANGIINGIIKTERQPSSSTNTTTEVINPTINIDPTDERIHLIHVFNPFVMKKNAEKATSNHTSVTTMSEDLSQSILFDMLGLEQWAMFQSIRRALSRINTTAITVDVVCAMYPEDASQLEPFLEGGDTKNGGEDPRGLLPCRTVLLNRSTAQEYPHLQPPKKLPFLQEILEASTSAYAAPETKQYYWMYTNSDIGISRDFYNHLLPHLRQHDALSINRVTLPSIPKSNQTTTHLLHQNHAADNNQTLLEAYVDQHIQTGVKHPGYDCFIVHSNILQRIRLGDFFAGYPPWGANIHLLLKLMADRYVNIQANAHGTFHLGDEMSWSNSASIKPTLTANQTQLIKHCPIPAGSMTPYSIQNTINCGKWFRSYNNITTSNSQQQITPNKIVPGWAIQPGYQDIFRQHNKGILTFRLADNNYYPKMLKHYSTL